MASPRTRLNNRSGPTLFFGSFSFADAPDTTRDWSNQQGASVDSICHFGTLSRAIFLEVWACRLIAGYRLSWEGLAKHSKLSAATPPPCHAGTPTRRDGCYQSAAGRVFGGGEGRSTPRLTPLFWTRSSYLYSPTCQHCVLGYELLPYQEADIPEPTGLAEYISHGCYSPRSGVSGYHHPGYWCEYQVSVTIITSIGRKRHTGDFFGYIISLRPIARGRGISSVCITCFSS